MNNPDNSFKEVKAQPMFCLVSPTGEWQTMTIAPSTEACRGIIKTMHKAKLGLSFFDLGLKGFKIIPVYVSLSQFPD